LNNNSKVIVEKQVMNLDRHDKNYKVTKEYIGIGNKIKSYVVGEVPIWVGSLEGGPFESVLKPQDNPQICEPPYCMSKWLS